MEVEALRKTKEIRFYVDYKPVETLSLDKAFSLAIKLLCQIQIVCEKE